MKKLDYKIFKVLFFLFLIIFNSCAVENLEEHEHSGETGIKSRKLKLNEFKANTKASTLVNSLLEDKTKVRGALNRIIRDTIRNFSFDTNDGLYLEYLNLHSYTFPIKRPIDSGKLENLVISYQNDGFYKVKLLVYNLTSQEKLDFSQNRLKTIQNPIISIPIDNFDTTFVTESCEEVTTIIYTSCSNGDHSFALDNVGDCSDWINGTAAAPSMIVQTIIDCSPNGNTSSGGTIGSGDSPWNGAGGPSGPITYPPSFPSLSTPPEEYENGLSQPVKTTKDTGGPIQSQPVKPPCDKVKDIANNTPNLKDKIVSFKTPAVLNLNYEKGFNFLDAPQSGTSLQENNGNSGTTFIQVIVPADGSMSGVLHSHFDQPNMLPTFSYDDLLTFNAIYQYREFNNKDLNKLTLMVVTRAGAFAMIIEDKAMFDIEGRKMFDEATKDEMLEDFYKDILDVKNLTDEDVIKNAIKKLEKFGVGLYKADDDLNNWNKLKVDNGNTITPVPCN